MLKSERVKRAKRKNRWATAKGRVVGVRLSENEYLVLAERAKYKDMSVGEYMRLITRVALERAW